jgi:hypothetical protein
MLILNRARIGSADKNTLMSGGLIESNVTFAPETLVTCAISRYSAGGELQVWFDGATSTFCNLNEGKVKSMQAQPVKGVMATAKASENPPIGSYEGADQEITI